MTDYERRIPPITPESDYTLKEACTVVRCAPSTMWRLIHRGDVDGYKVGNRIRITRASVEALRERTRVTPKQTAA